MKTPTEKEYDALVDETMANLNSPHHDPEKTRRLNEARARVLAKLRKERSK